MPDQTIEPTEHAPRRYRCRHIFTEGRRCGSPCLRGEEFCYYHHTARQSAQARVRDCGDSYGVFELPLEDRASIQSAIGEVIQRLAGCALDPKRAGLLLYGLQIASCDLPKAVPAEPDATPIERIVTDPTLGRLAPRALLDATAEPLEEEAEAEQEPKPEVKREASTRPRSIAELKDGYYRALDRLNKQLPEQSAPTETAHPNILPNLQASASPPLRIA